VTTTLLSGTDPHEVLVVVAQRAREIADAAVALVALPAGPGRLKVTVAEGAFADVFAGATLPIAGLAGGAFTTATPITLFELPADHVLVAAAGPQGIGAVTIAPLGALGAVRGILIVAHGRDGREFADAEVRLLQGFAAQAAVALELAERRYDAEQLVVFEDRDRIARDLHDLVIQRLFASGMALDSLTRLLGNDEAVAGVQRVVDDLDMTIKEIRSAIYDLQSPVEAGSTGLRSRLRGVAVTTAAVLGFLPVLQFDGAVDARVGTGVADDLVAVLREALTNVARHASATRVGAMLAVVDNAITLTVRDDGVGLSPRAGRSGLLNIAQRAEERGGTCRVTAVPEGGTEIIWQVPLR
jgi:signal transduction histidine kinase